MKVLYEVLSERRGGSNIMVGLNKKIGIVYCGNSMKYGKTLEKIIDDKIKEGYCIKPIMVTNELEDPKRDLTQLVFDNLNKCDFGIVFFTKDFKLENNTFAAKPNVLIELGYLRGRLARNAIWCITDFPYEEIDKSVYMWPSDYLSEKIETIDQKNYQSDLMDVVNKFISAQKIVKQDNYNANNLVRSLILNSDYKTSFEMLFSKDKVTMINKYSLQYQQEEIFKMWIEEKKQLSGAEQIIYLYERMVFIPFFPEEVIYDKLMDFLSVENSEKSDYIFVCYKILRLINEYEGYKRRRGKYESVSFYLKTASEIQENLNMFEETTIAPIIECIAKNYLGLCYLNAYLLLVKTEKKEEDKKQQEINLQIAKESFERVIVLSESNISDRVEVLQAFAKYNLARVLRNLHEDADSEYYAAIQARENLSKSIHLPQIFKLNFKLERIHAEIDYQDYLKEIGKIVSTDYVKKIEDLSREVEEIKKSPAADVSLFKTLENKLNSRKNSIS